MKKNEVPHSVSSQPCSRFLEVAESYIRVTLTEGWTGQDTVNFMICNNSPSDAVEIKALIKFHASGRELITARQRRDLFPAVLTGAWGQVRSLRLQTLLTTSKMENPWVRQPDAQWLGFWGFTDQRQKDVVRETSQAKYLQRKKDRKSCSMAWTWGSPGVQNMCTRFQSNLERKENPNDLSSWGVFLIWCLL